MPEILAGIDVGGTKCAVTLGVIDAEAVHILDKRRFDTLPTPTATLQRLSDELHDLIQTHRAAPSRIGISCGGPLNSQTGMILSPPNLPGWDEIAIVDYFKNRFHLPASLQNDANAGALAEWLWGAGRGYQNIIFLTFGTGMGAGLILDGRLYSGTNDLAGEVGHIRLAEDGPVGYGKVGSFEGFCSGGGIARLAASHAENALKAGTPPAFCPSANDLNTISAKSVAEAANNGDELALKLFDIVAQQLGLGLSLLIDILNPQRIIIGSIFLRQRHLLEARMWATINHEALEFAAAACEIVPPGLGELIGGYAALAVAKYQER